MTWLKVKELKSILNNFDDEDDVCVVDPETKYHIMKVSSVGKLECDYEKHDAIGLMTSNDISIKEETDYCVKEYFNGIN